MLEKEFNEIFKQVDEKWFVGLEIKIKLWESVKNIPIDDWKKIIQDILLMKKKPVLADFMELIREYTSVKVESKYEPQECGECGAMFTPQTEEDEYLGVCPKCRKWFASPEGRAKARQRKAELLNKMSGAQKNTDMETAIKDEPIPESEPDIEPEPEYPFELGDDGVPF